MNGGSRPWRLRCLLSMKVILASLCGGQNRAQVVAQSRNVLIGIGAAADRAPPHWQGSSLDAV
jgi:hypothetical protein